MIETEVLIVGGDPAGAACAARLKSHHIPCLILDRAAFPRAKPCAGWIPPEVFDDLQTDPQDYPYDLTEFAAFQISIRGIKFQLPTYQFAIRRIDFDAWLLAQSNVEFHQHDVKQIEQHANMYIIDGQFQAKILVGAGGTHCPVRRTFIPRKTRARLQGLILAKEEEFQYPVENKQLHLWFFKDGLPGYAWYVPKTNNILNVGMGASAVKLKAKGRTLNQYWESFITSLERSGLVKDHTFYPTGYSYYLRQRSPILRIGNIFLIGDALGLATADMGEGIHPAIQSGLLAADSISHGYKYSVKSIPRFSFPVLIKRRH